MPREDLVAALSMGPVPQQAMANWRRQRMAEELAKRAAFDPAQFAAGGQEMDLAQGVTDPNAKFQGGGASGSWAPEAEPPSTLGEWWEQSTAFRPMAEEAVSAATLPGDVYAGRVDPASDEAIDRAAGLAGMVTLGAGAVPAKGAELGMGIRAFHGSPHDFEKFSTEKIGIGEGTQMEGRGLYFGEEPEVGDFYADSTPLEEMARIATKAQGMHPDQKRQMIDHIIDIVDEEGVAALSEYAPPTGFEKAWNAVVQHVQDRGGLGGYRYEVDIAAEPEQFLDWHKPLAEHPPSIQQGVLGTSAPPDPSLLRQRAEAASGAEKEFLANQADYLEGKLQMTGGQLAPRSPEEMARLRDAGVPGIKYRSDGKRRDASNYVVFDDKLISILRKYGMAGMIGTPLGLEMAQRLMEQEQGEAANAL